MVAFSAVGPAGSPSAGVHGTTTPLSWTHILGGSDNAILVAVNNANSGTNNISSVTIGATNIAVPLIGVSIGNGSQFCSWYGLLNPPTGSQTVKVNFTGTPSDMLAGSVSFTGAGGFGTLFAANNGATSTSSQTVSVTGTTTGGMVAVTCAFGGQGWSAFTTTGSGGTINLSDPVSSTFAGDMQAIGTYPSTGSAMTVGFSAGAGGTDTWSVAAVEVLPGSTSTPTEPVAQGGRYWRHNRKNRKRLTPVIADLSAPAPFSTSVSAAIAPSTLGAGLQVVVVTGQAASFLGAIASAALPASSLIEVSITTTVTGSLVFTAGGHNQALGSAPAPAAGNTVIGSFADATNGCDDWAMRTTSVTGTPGAITVGETATTQRGAIAAMEVLAGTGLAVDGSTPAYAGVTTAGPAVSASFAPPSGALLIALVYAEGVGTSASQTTTVTDTGGLTWTKQVEQSGTTINGVAAVWTAIVPGGTGFGIPQADVAAAADAVAVTQIDTGEPEVAAAADAVSISAATPETEAGGAVESLAVSVTVPLAETAGAADAESPPVEAIALADAAGAVEALSVSAAVPLAEVAGATDKAVIAAAVPLAEVAAGVEAEGVSEPVTLADTAGAVDSLVVAAAVPLAEVAGAADVETVPAETKVPADAAGAAETLAVTAAVPVTDAAGAAEASSVTAAIPLAEAAGAADALTLTVTVPLADVAAALDALISGQPTSEADTASAAETISVAVTEAAAEAGAAVESLSVSVTLGLADAAGSTDAWIAGIATLEPDAAGAAEQVTITVTVPLAEVAAAAEALAVTATEAAADKAGAADALSVAQALPDADAAGAVESLSVAVTVALSELAAAVEGEGISRPVTLADQAAGADNFLVFTVALHSGTVTWLARPSPARWRPHPDPARWKATPARNMWQAEPGTARWKATPVPARWNAVLQSFDPISALSAEEVNIRWTSDLDGVTVDPTTTPLPVQAAFPVSSGNPLQPAQPVTWTTGSWLAGGTGKGFVSQHPVGPGTTGPTLAAGKYDVWGYIQGTPESPKKFVGVLTVY